MSGSEVPPGIGLGAGVGAGAGAGAGAGTGADFGDGGGKGAGVGGGCGAGAGVAGIDVGEREQPERIRKTIINKLKYLRFICTLHSLLFSVSGNVPLSFYTASEKYV